MCTIAAPWELPRCVPAPSDPLTILELRRAAGHELIECNDPQHRVARRPDPDVPTAAEPVEGAR